MRFSNRFSNYAPDYSDQDFAPEPVAAPTRPPVSPLAAMAPPAVARDPRSDSEDPWLWNQWAQEQDQGVYGWRHQDPISLGNLGDWRDTLQRVGKWNPAWDGISADDYVGRYENSEQGSWIAPTKDASDIDLSSLAGYYKANARSRGYSTVNGLFDADGKLLSGYTGSQQGSGSLKSRDYASMASLAATIFAPYAAPYIGGAVGLTGAGAAAAGGAAIGAGTGALNASANNTSVGQGAVRGAFAGGLGGAAGSYASGLDVGSALGAGTAAPTINAAVGGAARGAVGALAGGADLSGVARGAGTGFATGALNAAANSAVGSAFDLAGIDPAMASRFVTAAVAANKLYENQSDPRAWLGALTAGRAAIPSSGGSLDAAPYAEDLRDGDPYASTFPISTRSPAMDFNFYEDSMDDGTTAGIQEYLDQRDSGAMDDGTTAGIQEYLDQRDSGTSSQAPQLTPALVESMLKTDGYGPSSAGEGGYTGSYLNDLLSSGGKSAGNWLSGLLSGGAQQRGQLNTGLGILGLLNSIRQARAGSSGGSATTPAQLREMVPAQNSTWNDAQKAASERFFTAPLTQYQAPSAGQALARYGVDPRNPSYGPGQPPPGYARGGDVLASPLNRIAADVRALHQGPGFVVSGDGGGQGDMVDARLSPGEYVIDADVVAALGDGDNAHGARRLDQFREAIRRHKRSAPSDRIPPKARGALQYLTPHKD